MLDPKRSPIRPVSATILVLGVLSLPTEPAWADQAGEVKVVNREPILVKIEGEGLREIETIRKLPPVEIETSQAKALWVRPIETDRRPFQWSGEARWAPGQAETRLELKIPPGRRFHIELLSAYARLPKGQFVPVFHILTVFGRESAAHYLPLIQTGTAGAVDHFATHQQTRIGADGQTIVSVVLPRSTAEGEGRCWLTLSGYTE